MTEIDERCCHLLKVKRLSLALITLLIFSSSPIIALASVADEESVAKKESIEISSKIDQALDSVNAKYQELETLKTEVEQTKEKIAQTEADIQYTEKSIDKRTELMASRMQDMQVNQSHDSVLTALLSAENFSDFITRAYAITMIQGAERSKVVSLKEDKEKLDLLRETLKEEEANLISQETTMETETVALEADVSSLKTELANNQDVLERLANNKMIMAAQKQKDEAKAAAKAKQPTPVKKETGKPAEPNQVTPPVTETPAETPAEIQPEPTPEPTPPTSSGGTTMTMESTAYSYTQPGLSYYTATGIDLRKNSRVIAVDPNTIPLGSLVEVSGYGFAVAGDTGGDIKGNRIDVHFNSVDECRTWGRRTVTVTIK